MTTTRSGQAFFGLLTSSSPWNSLAPATIGVIRNDYSFFDLNLRIQGILRVFATVIMSFKQSINVVLSAVVKNQIYSKLTVN